jgi:hypothetical protein
MCKMEDSGPDGRLKSLLGKRGDELVQGCVEELGILHRELALLRREVSSLADYQASSDLRLVAAGEARPLPRTVTIDADQMLRTHDGFYSVEHTSDGTPFRWTGPSVQFCFSVFVDRSAGADVQLLALSSIDFEIQKKVALVADGQTIPVVVATDPPGFAIKAFLPPREDHGVTSLVFVLPAVLTPPDSNETRALGIAFARLSVTARMADSAIAGVPERLAAQ